MNPWVYIKCLKIERYCSIDNNISILRFSLVSFAEGTGSIDPQPSINADGMVEVLTFKLLDDFIVLDFTLTNSAGVLLPDILVIGQRNLADVLPGHSLPVLLISQ
jgi:hypothetical protein